MGGDEGKEICLKSPMYSHNDFRTSAAINVKRASMLDLIYQATYIRSEKFKKQTSPNMARGNQISNAGGTGMKAHHSLHARTACVRSRAYIRSVKFKKRTPPNMARGNQISPK